MENIVPIEGYEGYYTINRQGDVLNILTGKIRAKNLDSKGYYKTTLFKKGLHKEYRNHRLIATAFIPNPDNKPHINHKDGNRTNNNIDNLEWVTHKENCAHAVEILHKANYNRIKKVGQYSIEGELIKIFDSLADARIELGINSKNISSACTGRRITAGGFKWKHL